MAIVVRTVRISPCGVLIFDQPRRRWPHVSGTLAGPGGQFADRPDPRMERTRKHHRLDIITIAMVAVVGGADACRDSEEYGKAKAEC